MRQLLSVLGVLFGLMLLSAPATAQQAEGGYLYSPEGCDFQISLPAEPRVTKRCHNELQDKCSMMATYTQVFALDSTVNVYVSCRPAGAESRKNYTPDLLRTSLLARPGVSELETYDVTFSETDKALMGALLGAGETANGKDVMVYVAQLWVGDNSIFTFEGELIGAQGDQSDKLFAQILRSLHHKDDNPDSPADDSAEAAQGEDSEAEEPAAEE